MIVLMHSCCRFRELLIVMIPILFLPSSSCYCCFSGNVSMNSNNSIN